MDPEKYKLCDYEDIPIMTYLRFQELASAGKVVLFQNLIIDHSQFDHPGSLKIIQSHNGQQVSAFFAASGHSFNARLIVCHKTIGRLQGSASQEKGKQFYNSIKDSELNQAHQQIMSKFDFSKPLNQSISLLSMQELNLLTQIPKFFKDPSKVMIGYPKSDWDHKFSKNHHWYCIGNFILYLITIFVYLASYHTFQEALDSLHFVAIGYLFYALFEYLFHRYDLHHNMLVTKKFKGADMHHCFPNLPEKLSITVSTVNPLIIFLVIPSYFIFEHIQIAMMLAGMMTGVIGYNFIHYMCHLGPETNLIWLRQMKLHHLNHHYKDQHSLYGITTTLFDHIFRTHKPNPKEKTA